MKKEFSKSWKASKQPRKQVKYRAKAPLHLRKKFVSINLSKDLRDKMKKRNIVVKKDDVVKIMRGKYKNKQGKVLKVLLKISKLIVEGINVKKQDGSKAEVKMQPSNLQIITLAERNRKPENKQVVEKIETPKKEIKPKNTGEKK